MNTSLVDACLLRRLVSAIVKGERPESALDLYQQLRRPAAEQVLHMAGRLTRIATMKNAGQRAVRNTGLALVGRLPFARRRLTMDLSGLSRREAAELPL